MWSRDAVVAASILLSAVTYLVDFGSNLVVLVQYSTHFMSLMHREAEGGGVSSCDDECRLQTSELAGFFYGLLAILLCCHSLNALLFKLKFKRNQAPLCAAYFLPLIHLYRLSLLLWRTLSCKGIEDIRSPEMNGLYCILGSAMEGVPMLILQFSGYLTLTRQHVFVHGMSTTFKVSVAASLISAAYNGGTSVQSIAENATTFRQKLGAAAIGASFTFTATLARCLTFTYIIVYIRQDFLQKRTERDQPNFHVSDTIPMLVIGGSILAYLLYFWLLHSPRRFSKSLRDPRPLFTALTFSYMSMNLGPLYPLISQAQDANQLGSYVFRRKLLAVSVFHLLLDLAILCVTKMLGTLSKLYIVISSITAVGYMVSLIGYMKFDASCGALSASTKPPAHGDSDGNEHKLLPLWELFLLADADAQSQESNNSEADAVTQHVNSSSDKIDFARLEKDEANILGWAHEKRLFLSERHNLPEVEGFRPCILTSSLSLDSIATRRYTRFIAQWPHSLERPFRAVQIEGVL